MSDASSSRRSISPSVTFADQRSKPGLHQRALILGDAFRVDSLDEAVEHDKTKRPAVLQLLRRDCDANQHVAASGVSLLDRIGGGENIGDAHPPAADFLDDGGGLGLEFGKAPADRHIRDGDGEARSIGWRSQAGRVRQGYRPRWTGCRSEGCRRHL